MYKIKFQTSLEAAYALKLLKEHYHITNKEIAQSIGVTEATVSQWINRKAKMLNESQQRVEDYIATIWQPGIVCIYEKDAPVRQKHFFLVANIYDPLYTWMHHDYSEEQYLENMAYLNDLEKKIKEGKATVHIVKKYVDLDEADFLGHDEEQQYQIGAVSDTDITFLTPQGVVKKPALFYEPK